MKGMFASWRCDANLVGIEELDVSIILEGIGGVVSAAVLLAVIGCVLCAYHRRHKKQGKRRDETEGTSCKPVVSNAQSSPTETPRIVQFVSINIGNVDYGNHSCAIEGERKPSESKRVRDVRKGKKRRRAHKRRRKG